jgi:hypothetical protein
MALDTVGILTPIDFPLEQPTVISAVAREVFVNEAPLFGRLAHRQATAEVYTIIRYDVRQHNAVTIAADFASTSSTTLSLTDASPYQVGDVFEVTNGTQTERMEAMTAPVLTTTPNTIAVRRAREGTTGFAFLAATPSTARLIGNSRTGGEIDQQAFRPAVTPLQQIVQTFQFPVQIGGKAEAISNVALPPGVNSVMGRERAIKAVEFVRDVEYTAYYGLGEVPAAAGDRGKMKGLKTLIGSFNAGANVTASAGASYTRQAFIAATIAKIYAQGGMPDVVLCSTDFLGFLDTWVPTKTAVMGSGQTAALGFPITTFVLPLNAQPLTFVPSLQMKPGSAFVLSSNDLDFRMLREMFWKPRGVRGDAEMGDWIGDYAINVSHPQWHAVVENITSAA